MIRSVHATKWAPLFICIVSHHIVGEINKAAAAFFLSLSPSYSGSSVHKQNLAVSAPYGWKWLIPEANVGFFVGHFSETKANAGTRMVACCLFIRFFFNLMSWYNKNKLTEYSTKLQKSPQQKKKIMWEQSLA